MKKKSFTLIELIAVIVVLGIIAVTAIPEFVDLRQEAEAATAEAILGAAKSSAALNFARVASGQSSTIIDSVGDLLDVFNEPADMNSTTGAITIHDNIYTLTVSTNESDTAPAVITWTITAP